MTRGSGRRVRGLVVKIKTKGGTIFEVDEKVARIFGKIRTEMTYNGTFTRSMSNQAVTRLHSPLPVHSMSTISSTCSHLHNHQLLQQPSQNHCHCHQDSMSTNRSQSSNGQVVSRKRDNGASNNVSGDRGQSCSLDRCNNQSDPPTNENHSNCVEEVAPKEATSEEATSEEATSGEAKSEVAPKEATSEEARSEVAPKEEECQCCCGQASSVLSSRVYCPRVASDVDSNVIMLEKTRGGIFALMLRWAKHHMNDPLIGYMERQEELRLLDGAVTHTGSTLFTTASGRSSHCVPVKTSSSSSSSSSSSNYNHHGVNGERSDHRLDDVPTWDARFFSKLSRSQIYEMLHACSNLHVPLLTEMLAKTVADQMKGKSVEEVREEFGIVSDYTPEEEAALKEDYERYVEKLNDGTIDEDDLDAAFRATSIDNYRSIYGKEDDERLAARGRRCCSKLCNHRSNRGN